MTTVTIARVQQFISEITPEQIGKCWKVYDYQTRQNFYQVENSHGDVDEHGDIITYRVRYSREHGFTCSCPSGQNGFSNVKHPSGVCWHVRAAVAAAREERVAHAAIAAEQAAEVAREHLLLIDGKEASDEEYNRIVHAVPVPPTKRGGRTIKGSLGTQGFRLMR